MSSSNFNSSNFNKTSVTIPASSTPQVITEKTGEIFCFRGYHNFNKVLKALEPFGVKKDMISDWKKLNEEIETPEDFSDDFSQKWTQFRANPQLAYILNHDAKRPIHYHEHPILKAEKFFDYLLFDEINISGIPIEVADRDNMTKLLQRALPGLKASEVHYVTKGIARM